MANVTRLSPLNNTYGLPPTTWLSDEMVINSMPVFEITPCKPVFQSGLNLFSVEPDENAYNDILKKHGFATSTPIRLAFIADNFPTDSFTSEYGDTFLQKFTDVASQGMAQIMQMTGSQTATEGAGKLANIIKGAGEDFGNSAVGSILKSGGTGLEKMASGLQNFANTTGGTLGGGVNIVNQMLAGHRVDFPQVWMNSGFTPSYTATVRLYNPNPSSDSSTEKHIIGPLAVLLCLALPRSKDGRTYGWPFFHKIKSTGIYGLDPAVITNLTVVKGGDQQQISFNQKLGIVDVRIDFTSLYSSMLQEEGDKTFTNRPTLRSYLQALRENDRSLATSREGMNQVIAPLAGSTNLRQSSIRRRSPEQIAAISRREAAAQRQAPAVANFTDDNRVSAAQREKQLRLESQTFIS